MAVLVAESADDFFALLASIHDHAIVAWDRDVPSLPECNFTVVTFEFGDAVGRVYVQPHAGTDFDGFAIYELRTTPSQDKLGVKWNPVGVEVVRLADSAAARQVAERVAALRASKAAGVAADAGRLVNHFEDGDEDEDDVEQIVVTRSKR